MRNDGHDRSLFAKRRMTTLPTIDHEAGGPLSLLVRVAMWLKHEWRMHVYMARLQSTLEGRRWP